jgi:Cyclic nucleotide-binding domain
MRVEKSVTSVTWIPSEAITGMTKLPFEMGVAHYDDPPPDRLEDLETLRQADAFREANELRAWVEFDDGKPSLYGYSGGGHIGVTRIKLGSRELSFPAVKYPVIQADPEVRDGSVRFVQSAGGHMGLPAPRRVRGKPFFRVRSASAWTTLALTINADGSIEHELVGASPFPRHWLYDDAGKLIEKSGSIDFEEWYRESHGKNTPWGEQDSPAITTAVESELERELSSSIMRSDAKLERRNLEQGTALVTQGDEGRELYLILDGTVDVEVDGDVVAEIGPGALLGERALLEGGKRTATLWATSPLRVVVIPPEAIDDSALPELASTHRHEETGL